MASTLVQYVVVRTDLVTQLSWTVGAVIAQACHASTAATILYRDDEQAAKYYGDMDNMHKIVLGISSETKLQNLSKRLTDYDILHKVWLEQPENIATCLVTKPYPKGDVADLFKKLQLFRLPGDKNTPNKGNSTDGDKYDLHVHDNNKEQGAAANGAQKRMSGSPKLPPIGS